MNLNQSDLLKLVTSSTSALDVLVSFKDEGPNASPVRQQATAISSAATTTICSAPGAGTAREITEISIRNKGAASNTVTVSVVGSSTYERYEAGIGAEGHLLWLPAVGWTLTTPNTLGVAECVILEDDVANSGNNVLADVTGLSFPVTADLTYWFRFAIDYTAAAATTGSRWTINGPTSPTRISYRSQYTLSATAVTTNQLAEYDKPDAANADSIAAGSLAIIEGFITPSASGTVIARFASEVNASAITAKAGSLVEWKRVA